MGWLRPGFHARVADEHDRELPAGEPLVLPEAGHFVQEHGEAVARAAVGYFRP